MPEITGIDHIYIAVLDLRRSEQFYDPVMKILGFRKTAFDLNGEPHIQYYNRHFGYVLRPARSIFPHDPYSPGIHHFCLRVETPADVQEAAAQLRAAGIDTSEPKVYPEYSPDYHATFFRDPDGMRLEITNYRAERRRRHDEWDSSRD
jgi:glyoxylase I family protein